MLRVYKGDEPVKIENFQQTFQSHSDFTLTLGKKLNFEEDIFRIKLKKKKKTMYLLLVKRKMLVMDFLRAQFYRGYMRNR